MNMVRSLLLRTALIAALCLSGIALTGCYGYSDTDYIEAIKQWLADFDTTAEEGEEAAEEDNSIALNLTYPVGASPSVFTTGWLFGARCVVTDADGEERDVTEQVKWSGTGSFSPATGGRSRPSFAGTGANEITLSIDVGGKVVERTFTVNCVSPAGYAAVGDLSKCDADAHGIPADPFVTIGPITTGSPTVFVRGRPAARVGDRGVAAACGGANSFEIAEGDGSVLIDGRPAAKFGSRTNHCGGVGTLVGGS